MEGKKLRQNTSPIKYSLPLIIFILYAYANDSFLTSFIDGNRKWMKVNLMYENFSFLTLLKILKEKLFPAPVIFINYLPHF